MGFFGSAGLKSAFGLGSLLLQDIVARSFRATGGIAGGNVAFQIDLAGNRLKFSSGGTTDYFSSDGATRITAAGEFTVAGQTVLTGTVTTAGVQVGAGSNIVLGANSGIYMANVLMQRTAPTIVAGAGASIVASNGTAAFRVDLGGAAQTGTITFPAATTGWVLIGMNITTPAANVIGQTGTTTTTATFTNYVRTTGAAGNWTANDNATFIALAY